MQWLLYYIRRISDTQLAEIALEIANRHRQTIWQQIEQYDTSMNSDQLRGYIRSRTSFLVHAEVDTFLNQNANKDPSLGERFCAQLMDSILQLATQDIENMRVRERHAA